MSVEAKPAFQPYLPRLAVRWPREHPRERFRAVAGSLVSLDISGFTALSERLAARGRLGAEELILLISGVFEGLIGIADRYGGDVLKFRGDALLLLYSGEVHELRACRAASDMQWFIEQTAQTMSSVGPVELRMATGVYSGECHFYLVGSTHRELLVTGPAATATMRLEDAAEAGEILVSPATAAALDPAWLGREREGARLLALPPDLPPLAASVPDDGVVDPAALEIFVPATIRAHVVGQAGVGEHRYATVTFIKYTGTDLLLAERGPEAVLATLADLAEVVSETAADLDITWLESDIDIGGGKLYLTAGAPSSTGADEERMVRALRRIFDAGAGPPIQAGVNRGLVFAGDIGAASRRTYAVMGDTVNLAARLAAKAEPGEFLATADVLDRSRTRFAVSEPKRFQVKGKAMEVTAYGVGPIIGRREEEVERDVPTIGRDRELDVLRAEVEAARRGEQRLVELVGEPGVGKSRLVEELKLLAGGFEELSTRSEQYESSTPFFAFRPLLRRLAGIGPEDGAAEAGEKLVPWAGSVVPDILPWLPLLAIPMDADVPPTPETDSIDPAFRRDRLHEVVEDFLGRLLAHPTLLVFEDAHWMDDASDFLLRHLTRARATRPWLVCVTRRPTGRSLVAEGNGVALALEPLPAEAATSLVLAAAGEELALTDDQVAALAERSGGNPLFVQELVSASKGGGGLGTLPESVETLMTSRIDTLAPGDRLLLRYAAVVGPTFDLPLLDEILAGEPVEGADLERWQRLGGFVEWDGAETLSFRHDLVRAAAYEGLSIRRRKAVHGRVATALERRAGEAVDEAAGILSLHFFEAEEYAKAWPYAVAAGRRAQAMYANVVAGELYERALAAAEHGNEVPSGEVAAIWEALGDVSGLFGEYERAGDAYSRAIGLLHDDELGRIRAMTKAGRTREALGRYEEALQWYRRGLRLVGRLLPSEEALTDRAHLRLSVALAKNYQGDFPAAARWAKNAARDAEEAGDRRALGRAYLALDAAYTQLGRPDPSYRERALALYRETDDLVGQSWVLNNLGNKAYWEGRWDESVAFYEETAELARRVGDVLSVARAQHNLSELLSEQGRLDEAEELMRHALRGFRAARVALGVALVTGNLGRAAVRRGNLEQGRPLLEEALAAFEGLGAEMFALETRARLAEERVLARQPDEALAIATKTLAEEEERGMPAIMRALAERLIGHALVQKGLGEEALLHFERASELARSAEAHYELALALQALADVGAPEAEALRAESEEILARLGVVSVPRVPLP